MMTRFECGPKHLLTLRIQPHGDVLRTSGSFSRTFFFPFKDVHRTSIGRNFPEWVVAEHNLSPSSGFVVLRHVNQVRKKRITLLL